MTSWLAIVLSIHIKSSVHWRVALTSWLEHLKMCSKIDEQFDMSTSEINYYHLFYLRWRMRATHFVLAVQDIYVYLAGCQVISALLAPCISCLNSSSLVQKSPMGQPRALLLVGCSDQLACTSLNSSPHRGNSPIGQGFTIRANP